MKHQLIAITAIGVFFSNNAAVAIEVPCTAPDQPILPASLSSQSEVSNYELLVTTYQEASADYYQCVYDYATDNQATLTESDKAEIRAEYDAHVAETQTVAAQWNGLLNAFNATQ